MDQNKVYDLISKQNQNNYIEKLMADTYNKLFLFVSCLLNYYFNLLIQSFYTVSES